ncbi:hypothetical protein C1O63_1161 [Dehalococcoides mccartyi]|nr:hypothetical protein C1O63_1161 [Dehalococcoides mccartyi]
MFSQYINEKPEIYSQGNQTRKPALIAPISQAFRGYKKGI